MKNVLVIAALLVVGSAEARQEGFYARGQSASTEFGALALFNEIATSDDADVCYSGDFGSALENVNDLLSITVLDVYGESESPALDVEVVKSTGESAAGIVHSCK